MGLSAHQPMRVTNGIQKSRNWMLMSIARASAMVSGGSGALTKLRRLERMMNQRAMVPSAEKETRGRRMIPNHL